MKPKEIITVETTRPACDGGGGALGHPKVYLSLTDKPAIECPYCGRHFQLAAGAAHAAH
jgi:uncharacterized Zn-finger protein